MLLQGEIVENLKVFSEVKNMKKLKSLQYRGKYRKNSQSLQYRCPVKCVEKNAHKSFLKFAEACSSVKESDPFDEYGFNVLQAKKS